MALRHLVRGASPGAGLDKAGQPRSTTLPGKNSQLSLPKHPAAGAAYSSWSGCRTWSALDGWPATVTRHGSLLWSIWMVEPAVQVQDDAGG